MNSEIRIRLVGSNLPNFVPMGATIHYGINKIPCAYVQLEPSSLGLLCDFDALRRSPVDLYIDTDVGCLHFQGIIDGLSFSQSPGGLSANLVIKHPFQWLAEMFPRIVGLHPASLNVFRPQPALRCQISGEGEEHDFLVRYMTLAGVKLDNTLNLVDFIIQLLRLAVTTQVIDPLTLASGASGTLIEALKNADLNKKVLAPQIDRMLSTINTDLTKGLEITGATKGVMSQTITNVAMLRDSIWSSLVRMLSDIGCCLVIGNGTYVVPEASFLRVPKLQSTQRGKRASLPNTVFPAEYDNITFNDNGYVAVKGVYLTHDQQVKPFGIGVSGNTEMGSYIDPTQTGTILVTSLPSFISYGIVEGAVYGGQGLQPKLKNKQPLVTKKITIEQAKAGVSATKEKVDSSMITTRDYMKQLAQMEYCRIKYDDRTGSINTAFYNNWAPGAMGTLYTRLPGTYMDFFVTDVTHSFQLSAPNGGRANTTVMFKSGRLGAATTAGLDSIDLYKYDYSAAQDFSQRFIKDIAI